jgi:5-methylcytosine-specific restriction protein A
MSLPKELRAKVLARDHHSCRACGTKLDPRLAHVAHIRPRSEGGTDDIDNLQTLCPVCHYKADRIIDFVPSAQLARAWIAAFLRAPAATVIVSLLVGFAVALFANIYGAEKRKHQEEQRQANQSYLTQITKLNDTEQRLRELLAFVTDQRESLKQTEDAITALKSERDSLAPLVASQQHVVDALFAAQEKRNQAALSRERWIGFALGVGSSIVASALITIGRFFLSKSKAPAG